MQTSKRVRRGEAGWRSVLAGFSDSGLTAARYCERERISAASFYRWRAVLQAQRVHRASPSPSPSPSRSLAPVARRTPPTFVDLGTMQGGVDARGVELRLDLGGGLTLTLVRR